MFLASKISITRCPVDVKFAPCHWFSFHLSNHPLNSPSKMCAEFLRNGEEERGWNC